MPAPLFKKTIIAITLSILLPAEANADTAELEARILKLEKAIQAMQAQRDAQDKQLNLLTKELTAVDVQVTQAKIAKSEEKGMSKGTPVFAAFKDGVTLEDGTGNW